MRKGCGRRAVLSVAGGIVLLVVIISLAALVFQQSAPPVQAEPNWDSPQTRALAVRACFDCHSNQTRYPLYDRLPPASWLVAFDTIRGRRELNFSEWNTRQARKAGRDAGEQINRGEMPPSMYVLLHPEARLSDAEKQQLIAGLRATATQ